MFEYGLMLRLSWLRLVALMQDTKQTLTPTLTLTLTLTLVVGLMQDTKYLILNLTLAHSKSNSNPNPKSPWCKTPSKPILRAVTTTQKLSRKLLDNVG